MHHAVCLPATNLLLPLFFYNSPTPLSFVDIVLRRVALQQPKRLGARILLAEAPGGVDREQALASVILCENAPVEAADVVPMLLLELDAPASRAFHHVACYHHAGRAVWPNAGVKNSCQNLWKTTARVNIGV